MSLDKDDKKWIKEQLDGLLNKKVPSKSILDSAKLSNVNTKLIEKTVAATLKLLNNDRKQAAKNSVIDKNTEANGAKLLSGSLNKKFAQTSVNSVIFNNQSGSCHNYILAKEAIFNGGSNNIEVSANSSGILKQNKISVYDERLKKEATKKYNNSILNSLKSINASSLDMSKHIKNMSLLTMLKIAGIATLVTGALAAINWVKKEGLANVTKSILEGVKNIILGARFNKKGVEKQNKATIDATYGLALSSINVGSELAMVNKSLVAADNEFKSESMNIDSMLKPDTTTIDVINKLQKSNQVTKDQASILTDLTSYPAFDIGKSVKFSNSKSLSKLSFPVPTFIMKAEFTDKENGWTIVIRRDDSGNENNIIAVMGVTRIMVAIKDHIPANTLIALLGPNGKIFGDVQKFLNDKNLDESINANNQYGTADKMYLDYRTTDGKDKKLDKSNNQLLKDENYELEVAKLKDNPAKYLLDAGSYAVNAYNDSQNSSNVSTALNQTSLAKPKTVNSNVSPEVVSIQPATNLGIKEGTTNTTLFADPNPDATTRSSNRSDII